MFGFIIAQPFQFWAKFLTTMRYKIHLDVFRNGGNSRFTYSKRDKTKNESKLNSHFLRLRYKPYTIALPTTLTIPPSTGTATSTTSSSNDA